MNKALGVALLVAGILLLVFGFNESESAVSEVSKLVNNSPTDRAIWLLVGGGVATAVGLYLLVAKTR